MEALVVPKLTLSRLPKTWFIDIDGVTVVHNGYRDGGDTVLPGVETLWDQIAPDDVVVLTSARDETLAKETLAVFTRSGLRFDHALFGLSTGERILINDRKQSGLETAFAVNLDRDIGPGSVRVERDPEK